jgi:hypothetical protein
MTRAQKGRGGIRFPNERAGSNFLRASGCGPNYATLPSRNLEVTPSRRKLGFRSTTAATFRPIQNPLTLTGTIEPVVELFPSWPSVLIPQHSTDPPIDVAQANSNWR